MAKLKIFCGAGFLPGVRGQIKVAVAATSQKAAAKLLNVSVGEIRNHYGVASESSSAGRAALSKPGAVFFKSPNDYADKQAWQEWTRGYKESN